MAERIDKPALVAGVLVATFGVVLLLDAGGEVDLHFAALAPIAVFMAGAVLLALGLSRRD
jgi:hypothetical protein